MCFLSTLYPVLHVHTNNIYLSLNTSFRLSFFCPFSFLNLSFVILILSIYPTYHTYSTIHPLPSPYLVPFFFSSWGSCSFLYNCSCLALCPALTWVVVRSYLPFGMPSSDLYTFTLTHLILYGVLLHCPVLTSLFPLLQVYPHRVKKKLYIYPNPHPFWSTLYLFPCLTLYRSCYP